MDYIEWLVDTMLRVPVEHALDAPYPPIVMILRRSPNVWMP